MAGEALEVHDGVPAMAKTVLVILGKQPEIRVAKKSGFTHHRNDNLKN
jgi:hypothetical protein